MTYIRFDETQEIFGVSASVMLNEPALKRTSIGNEPICVLMFIDELGKVSLTSNYIRCV
jgi:hypothetical protein